MKIPVRIIEKKRTVVLTGKRCVEKLPAIMGLARYRKTRWFILVDENTERHCLPVLLNTLPDIANAGVIRIQAGETSKTLENAQRIWQELDQLQAERNSILVCLGGGVVSDLGGFIAAAFKRGIGLIHIPTSLVGQIDAALGGKTAVNLGHLKNQVGLFYNPLFVFVDPCFLQTLPETELISGIAELVKIFLVADPESWRKIQGLSIREIRDGLLTEQQWKKWVQPAITHKLRIIKSDFRESGLRKALNFGHTVGHALESYFIQSGSAPLAHGEAVAAGMVCAAWLSVNKAGLNGKELEEITSFIREGFSPVTFEPDSFDAILRFMASDKKNAGGETRFTLLSAPGQPLLNAGCTRQEIIDSLNYYRWAMNKNV